MHQITIIYIDNNTGERQLITEAVPKFDGPSVAELLRREYEAEGVAPPKAKALVRAWVEDTNSPHPCFSFIISIEGDESPMGFHCVGLALHTD